MSCALPISIPTPRPLFGAFSLALLTGPRRLVEKTVSNTVRVEFVRAVFPRCRFVHLLRDGRDVAASSLHQWGAPMEVPRALEKIRYLPLRAFPSYGAGYASKYLRRWLSGKREVASWGVEIRSLASLVAQHTPLEVCGYQWSRCVESALDGLETVPGRDQIRGALRAPRPRSPRAAKAGDGFPGARDARFGQATRLPRGSVRKPRQMAAATHPGATGVSDALHCKGHGADRVSLAHDPQNPCPRSDSERGEVHGKSTATRRPTRLVAATASDRIGRLLVPTTRAGFGRKNFRCGAEQRRRRKSRSTTG